MSLTMDLYRDHQMMDGQDPLTAEERERMDRLEALQEQDDQEATLQELYEEYGDAAFPPLD
jgi:hypothetical protein